MNNNLKKNWNERQKEMGSTQRSVLFKNFPTYLNDIVHATHTKFILENMPDELETALDLGCGYGRISIEIKNKHPLVSIEGVEIGDTFSEDFRKTIGSCFKGSMQDYQPRHCFDLIIIITALMYIPEIEIQKTIDKYWSFLNNGGHFICIEPYESSLIKLRKASKNKTLAPTGEQVKYFKRDELTSIFDGLPNASQVDKRFFGIIPFINTPRLHVGICYKKLKI